MNNRHRFHISRRGIEGDDKKRGGTEKKKTKKERCHPSDEWTAAEKNQPVSQTEISFMRLKEKQRKKRINSLF